VPDHKPTKGVLLLNLGTPAKLTISAVRAFLKEFLLDPRVVDLPPLFRYLLVYGIILPFRPYKTIHAYRQIWHKQHSPLLEYTQSLHQKLTKKLPNLQIEFAMRYGQPSVADALKRLQHLQDILVLPLFPQYASASGGSAIDKTLQELSKLWNIPNIKVISGFYDHPCFIQSLAASIKPYIKPKTFLLLSYHGIPQRHITKSHCHFNCQESQPCPIVDVGNRFCYRAQCYATSNLLLKALSLDSKQSMTAFQSRLGKTPWITPYTDLMLKLLREKGVKDLVVACPSFVADCLETLEEINIQAKQDWLDLGGKSFHLIPCLNDQGHWIENLSKIINQEI
jgi:ferrochelatase